MDGKGDAMKCIKHPWMEATRILEKEGQRYTLCAACAWKAMKNGERLLCPESGKHGHLDENETPIFD